MVNFVSVSANLYVN